MLTLQSADKQIIKVDYDIINISSTIRIMAEDLGAGKDDDKVIPLTKIEGDILKKVITWTTYHRGEPEPQGIDVNITDWDREFLKLGQSTLFKLIVAANVLGIKGLFNMTCKTVAEMIEGKSAGEIRDLFNIENDLSRDEMDDSD